MWRSISLTGNVRMLQLNIPRVHDICEMTVWKQEGVLVAAVGWTCLHGVSLGAIKEALPDSIRLASEWMGMNTVLLTGVPVRGSGGWVSGLAFLASGSYPF